MPLRIVRPGSAVAWLLIARWSLAVCTLGAAWSVYGLRLKEAYPGRERWWTEGGSKRYLWKDEDVEAATI